MRKPTELMMAGGASSDADDPAAQRALAAHHEAGHAVASVLRGGSELLSVRLDDIRHGEGKTWTRLKPADEHFVAYAGPWFEAAYLWGPRDWDDEDDDGLRFTDYVFGALLQQPGDRKVALAGPLAGPYAAATEAVWCTELTQVRSAVLLVADWLAGGVRITDAAVRAAVESC